MKSWKGLIFSYLKVDFYVVHRGIIQILSQIRSLMFGIQ